MTYTLIIVWWIGWYNRISQRTADMALSSATVASIKSSEECERLAKFMRENPPAEDLRVRTYCIPVEPVK